MIEVCQGYLVTSPEPKLAVLLRRFIDDEQEIVYRLARALRQIGEPSGDIEADPRLRAKGMRHESTPDRVRFLGSVTEQAVARCQAQAAAATDPDQKAVWEEVVRLTQEQAAAVDSVRRLRVAG